MHGHLTLLTTYRGGVLFGEAPRQAKRIQATGGKGQKGSNAVGKKEQTVEERKLSALGLNREKNAGKTSPAQGGKNSRNRGEPGVSRVGLKERTMLTGVGKRGSRWRAKKKPPRPGLAVRSRGWVAGGPSASRYGVVAGAKGR